MCGIAGQMRFDGKSPSRSTLLLMNKAMAHRGPDDSGIIVDGVIGLASSRLAIQDLTHAGHMPMRDTSGRYQIVFNGEIYNFKELRADLVREGALFHSHSDTEVILELYSRHGVEMLGMLRGMFAIAIWDNKEKELFLARDRFGKKPLKYWIDKDCLIFGSELKSILAVDSVPRDIDWPAIDEYLTYHYVPAPRTGFVGIFKLPPATWMRISENGSTVMQRYWSLKFEPKLEMKEDDWLDSVDEKLRDSVRARLVSDVSVGAHLSGGIDSGLVVSYMSELSEESIPTFTMGFSEAKYDERKYARAIADKYHTQHHEFIVGPQDVVQIIDKLAYSYEEPYADASALPTWLLAEKTREVVTVALNGDGGDELFGGYERYQALRIYQFLDFLGLRSLAPLLSFTGRVIDNNKHSGFGRRLQVFGNALRSSPQDFMRSLVSHFDDNDRAALYEDTLDSRTSGSRAKTLLSDAWHETDAKEFMDHVYGADIATSLSGGLLPKVDIATMAHSLEVRSPFLDHELAELVMAMPTRLKTTLTSTKVILKRLARRRLPRECVDRPKQGFSVPLRYWFRSDLFEYITEQLTDPRFLVLGFRTDEIQRYLSEHKDGIARHDARLWSLLLLKRWLVVYGFITT